MPNLFLHSTPTNSNPGNQANSNPSTLIPEQIKNVNANLDSNLLLKSLTESKPNKDHSQIGTRTRIQGTRIKSQPVLSKSNTTTRTNSIKLGSKQKHGMQSQRTYPRSAAVTVRQRKASHVAAVLHQLRLDSPKGVVSRRRGRRLPPIGLAGEAARRSGIGRRGVLSPTAGSSLHR
jgi:hypothetical protein